MRNVVVPLTTPNEDRKGRKVLSLKALLCVLCVLCVLRLAAQSPDRARDKGWWDFGGGPSASHFVDLDQIKKWQVPLGDDPATLAAGGPANTGSLGARNGMVVTKAGIVFVAGSDRKVRAYDEDDGHVLWTGTLPGSASGIPVSYEAKGRQFVVIASPAGGRRGEGPDASADTPRGYIAFALPR